MNALRFRAIVAAAAAAITMAACSSTASSTESSGGSPDSSSGASSAGPSAGGGTTTLTLWHNYGAEQNATATESLVKAFEAENHGIKIKVVSQPADNYFSLLQASAISKTGPDIAVMWTGLFTLKYKDLLTPLKGLVPDGALSKMEGLQWTAENFDPHGNPYVMPLETQFYIGFYNKDAFKAAGISSVPKTWAELSAACTALKSAGYTPLVYGNGGQSLGAEFYPWYDVSYVEIGSLSVDKWRNLYDGQTRWNSPEQVAAFSKWANLESSGCTNTDVLTKTDNIEDFLNGKAAMIIDGTWDTQKFTDKLGNKVAAFVPPFSDTPIKGVVDYAGDGFGITSYSPNKEAAAKFLAFISSDAGVKAVDDAGLIPDVAGAHTSNPVNQQMLDFVEKDGMTPYPMLDNVVQGDVVDLGNKTLPSILAGKITPQAGLKSMNTAWEQLDPSQRSNQYK